jgi:hypothetical protein
LPPTSRSEPSRGRLIAVEGASGVGKTATARALSKVLSAARIPEAYERLQPPPSLEIPDPSTLLDLERTLLQEESRRFREAEGLRARGRDVVVDTGFLGPVTYTAGLAALDPRWAPARTTLVAEARRLIREGRLGIPDRSVYLDLGARAVADRVRADPAGHPTKWAARHARVAVEERALWLRRVRRSSPERLLVVRADRPASTLAEGIRRELATSGSRRRPSASEALRFLNALSPRPARRRRVLRPRPPRGSG